jgi:hypothetical protein
MLYISTPEDLFKSPGVLKKIQSQVSALSILLKDKVLLICVKGGKVLLESYNDHNGVVLASFKGFRSTFDKLSYYRFILENWNTIKENHGVQLAYIRLTWYDNYLLKIISQLKFDGFSVLVEIPTSNFRYEYFKSGIKGWYKILNFLIYGPRILSLADVIVSIGSFSPVLRGMESKTLVITNGIGKDVLKKPLVHSPQKSEAFNLIGVANVAYWHGYDRVIIGLWEYYRKTAERRVYFHIVGDGAELPKLKKLTKKLKLEEYVVFDGPKHGEELDKMFEKMHVGIGALGNHRKKLLTTSELKIREYCARGIPFVSASYDPDFPKDFPFSLRIPSDESPIDIQKVISFYKELKKTHSDYPLLMRKYAEEHLSWKVKMKPLVEKIMEMRWT